MKSQPIPSQNTSNKNPNSMRPMARAPTKSNLLFYWQVACQTTSVPPGGTWKTGLCPDFSRIRRDSPTLLFHSSPSGWCNFARTTSQIQNTLMLSSISQKQYTTHNHRLWHSFPNQSRTQKSQLKWKFM